jgi:hypothetical protein
MDTAGIIPAVQEESTGLHPSAASEVGPMLQVELIEDDETFALMEPFWNRAGR